MDRAPSLLPPGVADCAADLEIALVGHRLHDARLAVRELRRDIAQPGAAPCAAAAAALAAGLRQALATCDEALRALEPAFLLAHRHHKEAAAAEARAAAFRAAFRERLVYAGSDTAPRFWSHVGWVDDDPGRPLALSRDRGQVILGAGLQGCGKTVFSTVAGAEGSEPSGEPLTSDHLLPTASVLFHIEEHERLPQLLDGLSPNPVKRDLDLLMERLGASPAGLRRVRLATLASLLPDLAPRLLPYEDQGLEVVPIRLPLLQLGQAGLEAALGQGSGARFVQRMLEDAARQGRDLTVAGMRRFVDGADDLNAAMKRAAHVRLDSLEEIEAPPGGPDLWDLAGPGVHTVFYLGGPRLSRGRVPALVCGLLHGLLLPSRHGAIQRVINIEEPNLIAEDPMAMRALVRIARLVRHLGVILMLLGQDLLSIPDELFALCETCLLFQQRNPRCVEYVRERFGPLRGTRFSDVEHLGPAEAILGTTHSTLPGLQQGRCRVRIRPPRCFHGGFTRAAA